MEQSNALYENLSATLDCIGYAAESVTKLHVIAQDPKLREIFYGIVQSERAKRICTTWETRKGG
ncbi:MAG: hypothetical protein MR419_07510 [Clostridiales bacterium]|nr:hypothetical protein [Clostridiales bacterium]MDY4172960.1 hypothetical protein [Evtepia sp.]